MQLTKPSLILSIRVESEKSRRSDDFEEADLGLRLANKWTELFSLKLRELDMRLPGIDEVYIITRNRLPYLELVLKSVGTQVASFECGIDRSRLPDSIHDRENLLLDIIAKSFELIPGIELSELEKVNFVRKLLIATRLDSEILVRRIGNSDFDAHVLFTAGAAPALILRLTDLRTGLSHSLTVLSLHDPRDAYWLVNKVQIKRDCVRIVPRASAGVRLKFRNSYVLDLDAKGLLSKDIESIEIPLALVLNAPS